MKNNHVSKKIKAIDGVSYTVNCFFSEDKGGNKTTDTIFIDFCIKNLRLRDHFIQYGADYTEKPASIFFDKIRKEIEAIYPKQLMVIINYTSKWNSGSPKFSDFVVNICYYPGIIKFDRKTFFDTYRDETLRIGMLTNKMIKDAVNGLYEVKS